MRKLSVFFVGVILSFLFAFCGYNTVTAVANGRTVYIGGMSAGFTLKTGTTQIVGMCEVISEKGVCSPALEAGLKTGDCILTVNSIKIETVAELNELVNKSQGKNLQLSIKRGKEELEVSVTPSKDKISNQYKMGVLVRDSVSGIGTVTYVDKTNNRFGALGHTVIGENEKEMKISDGMVYECSIIGVCKGIRGKAGELRGMFLNDKLLGNAEKLCNCGIFGTLSGDFSTDGLIKMSADSNEATLGKAYIYSTVSGNCPKRYEIEIVKVDKYNRENKNYVIKIVDEELISETGGIVQGMSGSPIIQNDKLIGAVTHVFLNDPTRGYGIDVDIMLKE